MHWNLFQNVIKFIRSVSHLLILECGFNVFRRRSRAAHKKQNQMDIKNASVSILCPQHENLHRFFNIHHVDYPCVIADDARVINIYCITVSVFQCSIPMTHRYRALERSNFYTIYSSHCSTTRGQYLIITW